MTALLFLVALQTGDAEPAVPAAHAARVVQATRDWPLIWSLIGAAAVLTVVGLMLLVRRR